MEWSAAGERCWTPINSLSEKKNGGLSNVCVLAALRTVGRHELLIDRNVSVICVFVRGEVVIERALRFDRQADGVKVRLEQPRQSPALTRHTEA